MPSSNHRSSSSRASRRLHSDANGSASRASSVPHRQFIFILTNNPELIRLTPTYRPQIQGATSSNAHREQALNDLLEVELREAARDFLARTRRSFPVHYVFDASDVEPSPRSTHV